MTQMEKQKLTKKLQVAAFALKDTILFLDTHPDDQAALEYYSKQKMIFDGAVKEYEAEIGPLTAEGNGGGRHWTWVDTPMPWEMED